MSKRILPESSRYAQMQKKQETISPSDYFRSPGASAAKARGTNEEALRNASVKNTYGIQTHSTTYRNFVNDDFYTLVTDENVKEIKLTTDYSTVSFPKEANNRCQYFYAPNGRKVDYKEVTSVESIEPSKYESDTTNRLSKIGFNEFYNLYVGSDKLCIMAIYRG